MDAPAVLADNGRDMIIHCVLIGGPAAEDTLAGAAQLLTQMPEPARFVIWINEFFGETSVPFEETAVYAVHRSRIAGVVRIHKRGRFFADDIAKMLTAHQTYAEAIEGAFVMTAQRLVMVRRAIWQQLDQAVAVTP